jgi:hypothetical protein
MPQQQLDYQSPLGNYARPPIKRIVALACMLSVAVAYNVFLARWKVAATVPSPAATFIDQSLAPSGNLMLGGIFVSVVAWLPLRAWSRLACLLLCVAVPLLGWQAVEAVR